MLYEVITYGYLTFFFGKKSDYPISLTVITALDDYSLDGVGIGHFFFVYLTLRLKGNFLIGG